MDNLEEDPLDDDVEQHARPEHEAVEGAKQAHASVQAELKEMSAQKVDVLKKLHPQMPALVQLLTQQASRFRSPPCGPVGAHVKLNAGCEGLALAAETALRAGLCAFVVTCTEDEQLLRGHGMGRRGGHAGWW